MKAVDTDRITLIKEMKDFSFKQDNKKIEKLCYDLLGKENIILIHYIGSIAYHLKSNSGDYDVMVITKKHVNLKNVSRSDNSFQLVCLKNLKFISKLDLFVVDFENAIKIHNLRSDTSSYIRNFIDSTLSLNDTLIFENENFKRELQIYKNLNIESKIVPYYKHIIRYYKKLIYVVSPGKFRKHEHHIFRFLDNFSYFLKNGYYSHVAYGEHFNIMLDFKYSSQKEYQYYLPLLEEALSKLEKMVNNYARNTKN
ncbi:hypothetical protein [Lactobacillus isalae]|uniref:hypothetical protein n=1 Tax=Lactobacillus isalae TaxID=2993455 RepID=UPI0024A881EF|nr:hypothetical protein [Lactobacillus isalae]